MADVPDAVETVEISNKDDMDYQWQTNTGSQQERTRYLYHSGDLTDITFIVGEPGEEKAEIKGHSLILAMSSSVFRAIFFGSHLQNKDRPTQVDLQDMSAHTFRALLKYVYLDTVELDDALEAFKLYIAADKYIMGDLKIKCRDIISGKVEAEDAMSILNYAIVTGNNELKECVRATIELHPERVFKSPDMLTAEPATVCALLSEFRLSLEDHDIYPVIVRWCTKAVENVDPAERLASIRNNLIHSGIMKRIDLSKMAIADFFDVIRDSGLFADSCCFGLLHELFSSGAESDLNLLGRPVVRADKNQCFLMVSVNDEMKEKISNCEAVFKITSTEDILLDQIWADCIGRTEVYLKGDNRFVRIGGTYQKRPSPYSCIISFNRQLLLKKGERYELHLQLFDVDKFNHLPQQRHLSPFSSELFQIVSGGTEVTIESYGKWYSSLTFSLFNLTDDLSPTEPSSSVDARQLPSQRNQPCLNLLPFEQINQIM